MGYSRGGRERVFHASDGCNPSARVACGEVGNLNRLRGVRGDAVSIYTEEAERRAAERGARPEDTDAQNALDARMTLYEAECAIKEAKQSLDLDMPRTADKWIKVAINRLESAARRI